MASLNRWPPAGLLVLVVVIVAFVAYYKSRTGELPEPDRKDLTGITVDSLEAPSFFRELEAWPTLRAPRPANCDQSNAIDELLEQEREERLERIMRDAVRVLQVSADADHLLAVALLSWRKQPQVAIEALSAASVADKTHPLVAAQLLQMCSRKGVSCEQSLQELEKRAIHADRGNGMLWVLVARSRLLWSDESGALSALKEAVAATTVDEYWIDYVMLFDRSLAASSSLSSIDRLEAAFGIAAAVPSTELLISRDCEARAAELPEWLDVCIKLGERLERDGHTTMSQGIGLGLQKTLYKLAGDARQQEITDHRYQKFRQDHLEKLKSLSILDSVRDESVMRKYVEVFAVSDEFAALDYLATEVERIGTESSVTRSSNCSDP